MNWYFLGVDITCCHSHTDKTQVTFIIFEIHSAHPRPRRCPRGLMICAAHLKFSKDIFDVIFGEEKQVLSASSSLCGRALHHRVHNYASRQTAGGQ